MIDFILSYDKIKLVLVFVIKGSDWIICVFDYGIIGQILFDCLSDLLLNGFVEVVVIFFNVINLGLVVIFGFVIMDIGFFFFVVGDVDQEIVGSSKRKWCSFDDCDRRDLFESYK